MKGIPASRMEALLTGACEFAAQATPSAFAQRGDGLQCGPGISRRQVFGQFTFGDRQHINP